MGRADDSFRHTASGRLPGHQRGLFLLVAVRVQILPGLPRRLLRRRMLHGKKILQEAGLLLLAFARRFRLSTLASCSDAQTPGFTPGVCFCCTYEARYFQDLLQADAVFARWFRKPKLVAAILLAVALAASLAERFEALVCLSRATAIALP